MQPNGSRANAPDASHSAEVRAALDRLLHSPEFRIPGRRERLLRYLVDGALSGDAERISEYAIGVDVFEKPASFDPKSDAVVRAEISRLRQNLKDYYALPSPRPPVRIDLPPRGYFPVFVFDPPPELPATVAPAAAPFRTFPWRRTILAAILLACMGGGILAWRARAGAGSRINSLVVLPFDDHSPDHQSEYLADGLTDEVTNDLANLKDLRVIARTSAFQFKGKGVDIRQIGRQLNVEAALEGSVIREGDRIHIRAQLNRTADGYHLWSHSYDATVRDLISVERDIARSIADDLQWGRSGGASRSLAPPVAAIDPEAHDLYLRGLSFYSSSATPDRIGKGIGFMQSAIARDPHYAAPWFVMAKLRETLGWLEGWPTGVGDEVRSDLEQALERDPTMADAHANLAILDWEYDYDWPRAEREFQLALQPGNREEPHKLYGWALADRGRFAESHQHLRMAEDLAPQDAELLFIAAGILVWERKYAEAEQKFLSMLEVNPNSMTALASLANIKALENDCAQADEYAARMAHREPAGIRTLSARVAVQVCRGDTAAARKLLPPDDPRDNRLPAFELAKIYAYMGDKDAAIRYLDRAVSHHVFGATSMAQVPFFQPLHDDPRFIDLERRAGLDAR